MNQSINPTDEQQQFRAAVRQFAADKLAPLVDQAIVAEELRAALRRPRRRR